MAGGCASVAEGMHTEMPDGNGLPAGCRRGNHEDEERNDRVVGFGFQGLGCNNKKVIDWALEVRAWRTVTPLR